MVGMSNLQVILVFHALTGDQFCTNINPITKREGWWTFAVGPGKAIDTNKYFVICANVLGGCMGSFGPKEINPETNVLVIEDVITTGGSVKEVMNVVEAFGGIVMGVAVIVDRSNGLVGLHENQFSLVPMEVLSYEESEIPEELAAIPTTKPGSRSLK